MFITSASRNEARPEWSATFNRPVSFTSQALADYLTWEFGKAGAQAQLAANKYPVGGEVIFFRREADRARFVAKVHAVLSAKRGRAGDHGVIAVRIAA